MVADPIPETVADHAYLIQPRHQRTTITGGYRANKFESSVEHTNQRIEVTITLVSELATESRSAFAVEHHQLRKPGRFAASFPVTRDRLFRFHHRRILAPQ